MAEQEKSIEELQLLKNLRLCTELVNALELGLTAQLVKHYHLYRSRFWGCIRNSITASIVESVK